jgi:ROK family
MNDQNDDRDQLPTHGAMILPRVKVDSYNLEIEDEDGFPGDKVSRKAFWDLFEKIRKPLKKLDQDPLGEKPAVEIGKKKLATLLAEGDPETAALVQSAVEEFAQELAKVIRKFLRLKEWRDTECVVIGGGFRASRIGELAVSRCAILLKSEGIDLDLELIRNEPDEAGLLGGAYLLPPWMLKGYDGILTVDIGGTNIRTGVVKLNLEKAEDLSKASVAKWLLWRHADEDIKREDAIEGLIEMLQELLEWAEDKKLSLAPLIAIGCPGVIEQDGSIARGAQNLPGNWESKHFDLPNCIHEEIPKIGEHNTMIVMHNDAVVQGLSQIPYVKDREHWGVLTIGTGLGNARFTNRHRRKGKASKGKSS